MKPVLILERMEVVINITPCSTFKALVYFCYILFLAILALLHENAMLKTSQDTEGDS
jgi:integral membrane sensor domain MASE1